jgi:hypothetical protein
MNGHKLILVIVLVLGACATAPYDLADWSSFADQVDRLSSEELAERISGADEQYRTSPDDLKRLQLAWLLSRPAPDTQDVEAGRQLLEEIDNDSPYSALRDVIRRQIVVENKLQAARQEIRERNSEIEFLQQQIGQLEPRIDREAEVEVLRARVHELESKLEALKSIETEMSKGQKAIDEMPDE